MDQNGDGIGPCGFCGEGRGLTTQRPAFLRSPGGASAETDIRRKPTAGRLLQHVQRLDRDGAEESVADGCAHAITISAIVPATDAPETLLRCCDALIGSDEPPDEIVVVDSPGEANAATARNLGAERAEGDILFFIDADVEVRPDALRRIRAAFADDASLSAVFGSYDDTPAAPGVASRFRNLLHYHVHQNSPGPASTFWTGLGAVRREAFCDVGGFDEEIEFMEDVDLGMRMSAAGAAIVLDPRIQGTHLKRWTVWSMIRTDVVARGVPWIRILLRHRRATTTLNLGWRHRLSSFAAVSILVAIVLLQPLIVLAALMLLVTLNWRFYALLVHRRGPFEAAGGVVLHVLHHLACVVSIPIGVALHLRDSRRERRAQASDGVSGVEDSVASPV
jgi:GT2 family glycosyltransferase